MRIKLKCIFVFIFLFLAVSAYAKSSVWVAEKEGKKIILAGSMHLLKPSQLPLPVAYTKALKNSKRIVFELNMDKIEPTEMGLKMAQIFKLDGVTLQETLQPETWQALEKTIKDNKVPYPLSSFDAAFISFSLPVLIWQKQGYQAGVDEILYQKAKKQRKIIEGLETLDEQLAALEGLKKIGPDELITNMLDELANPKLALDRLVKDLYRGNQSILNERIIEYKKGEDKIFYQSLLVNRNQAWLVKIDQYIKDGTPTMVIVGAMHLAGQDGLLEQLKKRGYKVSYFK